ncbi:hypothetical protein Tco_0858324 [Tanacetum coccineum]|uniref:Uncharacterized protein n=1 Tax=Tanacetum coccineum TaxID=301880 RepID=A0ABQ5BAZ5_9ASTR
MAQQQHAADVHPDELCPPNKRYDLMDANKKVDLEHVQCPPESKILTNIIKNHPLRFSIAASSSVPWIYMAQFWHTLKEDGSKYRLRFMLDKKELSLTLDNFRTIFHLPQANDNNHNSFVPPPSFSDMVSFYKQQLGFTIELKTSSNFKTTGLLQPSQTLCKMFSKCLTTRVTGWDQPPLQIMQMMHCFVNNIHVDYAELLWEGIYYSFHHPTSSIPRSTHLTPPVPVPTIEKVDKMILQATLQVSLAEHKSREKQEAKENVELVNKHLASEEIEKLVEGFENVIDDSLPPRNDEPQIPGTRLEPWSDKESPEVERTNAEEVEVTNVVIPVNVNEEEDEITDEVYELKRRGKGKIIEESRSTPLPIPIRSPRTHTNLVSSDTEKLQELKGRCTYLFEHLKERFLSRKSFDTLADHLQEVMVESLPTMVDTHIKEQVKKQVPEQRGNIQAEVSSQIQKAIDNQIPSQVDASVRSYMFVHILHVHQAQTKHSLLQNNNFKYISSMKRLISIQQQDIAIWLTLQMKFESLQCNYGQKTSEYEGMCLDSHCRIKSSCKDLLHKEKKEPGKPKEEVYSNSKIIQVIKTYWELGHEHKFITEIVARRANECIVSITEPDYKNLNKNDIEDMYLLIMNGKVPDYAETGLLWSLSVFIRSSVIWERVHDFQLGIESYQQKVNLTAPTISFPGVEKHKMFSIIYEPVHGIIYKNSKKEKRVMRHSEIHKFCDATLNRVLEGLKSYNNDVKYGYVQRELTNDEVEYLKLFEEEIEVRLKYRNQMRRWEMYVNGRPLGPRRERPE